MELLLKKIESPAELNVLGRTWDECLSDVTRYLGPNMENWQWSRSTQAMFHPSIAHGREDRVWQRSR